MIKKLFLNICFCYIIAHMLKDLPVKEKRKALVIDIGDASIFRAVV